MNDMIVKSVDLFGDSVMAAKDKDGNIWAGVSYFCKALGMDKAQKDNQVERVQKDDVLKRVLVNFRQGYLTKITKQLFLGLIMYLYGLPKSISPQR